MTKYIFPVALIVLDFGAAIVYAAQKDIRMATYWFAAAVLNITVTMGGQRMIDIITCILVLLMARGVLDMSLWVIFWLLVTSLIIRTIVEILEKASK